MIVRHKTKPNQTWSYFSTLAFPLQSQYSFEHITCDISLSIVMYSEKTNILIKYREIQITSFEYSFKYTHSPMLVTGPNLV